MATRDKKPQAKKRSTSVDNPKEDAELQEGLITNPAQVKCTTSEQESAVKLPAKRKPKSLKKTFKIKIRPKNQVIAKKLIKKPGVKKALIRNGLCNKKLVRKNVSHTKEPEIDEGPPVLEPMLPLTLDNVETGTKKKVFKKPDDAINSCSIMATIDSIISQKKKRKPKLKKQPKIIKIAKNSSSKSIDESIDNVVNNLQTKLKPEQEEITDFKMEVSKELEKEIKLEDTTTEPTNSVIDELNLDKHNISNKTVTVENRRHSIHKITIRNTNPEIKQEIVELKQEITPKVEVKQEITTSLKSKRPARLRKGLVEAKRLMRSDSPARTLRNGKKRKGYQLLEGIESDYKKRKRHGSDFSGSEVSKFSGYESDSSFSDMASLSGVDNSENMDSTKEFILKKELLETLENNPPDSNDAKDISENFSTALRKSLELETRVVENKSTDDNFNLCAPKKEDEIKKEIVYTENITPSFKVPEKSFILNIMKQTFNDVVMEDQQEQERINTRSSVRKQSEDGDMSITTLQFYGSSSDNKKDKKVIEENKDCDREKDATVNEVDEVLEDNVDKDNQIMLVDEVEKDDTNKDNQESIVAEENLEEIEAMNINIDPEEEEKESNENMEVKEKRKDNVETPERLVIKTQILQALGLQSLTAAKEAKVRTIVPKNIGYTGTLKTVIKLNKNDTKRSRTIKLPNKKGKVVSKEEEVDKAHLLGKEGTITSWKAQPGTTNSSDTAGGQRKSHYSNRSNMDGSSEQNSDGDTNPIEEEKLLVIPEKASSFSIHPDRLCKDECSYCFGKFGLFDTPCHIAQMKSFDRQNKILAAEKHLARDSCLCDACYRHVDRKLNNPLYQNPRLKRNMFVAPGPRQNHCHVLGCGAVASNILRRKWLIKMKKAVSQVINIDLDNPGLHSIPVCEHHYAALEHLMVCAMCKRRLARNHVHYLGSESSDLHAALNEMMIPVILHDKPVVCKPCRYYATLLLKNEEDRPENSSSFFAEYTKQLLHFYDVEDMNEEDVQDSKAEHVKDKSDKENFKKSKRSYLKNNNLDPPVLKPQVDLGDKTDELKNRVPLIDSGADSSSDYFAEYNINLNAPDYSSGGNVDLPFKDSKSTSISVKRVTKMDNIKDALEKSKKFRNSSDIAVQKLGSNPSISVRQLFPCEEELPLVGNIEFNNIKEKTPEGWEKCNTTIQYDHETKMLWNELQRPYGNQSSFLRHLVLLEKYFRNGDLTLSPNATHHSINYTQSVLNRLRAYDNIPTNPPISQSVTILPFNKKKQQRQKTSGGLLISESKKIIPSTSTKSQLPPLPPLYRCISSKQIVPSSESEIIKTKPPPLTLCPNLMPNPIAIAAAAHHNFNNTNINYNNNMNFNNSNMNFLNYNETDFNQSNQNNITNDGINETTIVSAGMNSNSTITASMNNNNTENVIFDNSSTNDIIGSACNNKTSTNNASIRSDGISNANFNTSNVSACNSNISINNESIRSDGMSNASMTNANFNMSSTNMSNASLCNTTVNVSNNSDSNIMNTINSVVNNSLNINGEPILTSTPTSSATTSNLAPLRQKVPPGLISLQAGGKLPSKLPHKIKFPITKNWRPNLIPIDPNKKPERKQGLVQVISGGKPYHITLEDYKKMCAIKRTFDLRQKRLQETQKSTLTNSNSIFKKISPKKPSVTISKTSTATRIDSASSDQEFENNLERLDETVAKLEAMETTLIDKDKSLIISQLPKSLTVIPQTVTRKSSRSSSPNLLISTKNKYVDNNS